MKRIQVLPYCDGDHEGLVEATVERTIKIDQNEARELDLCEACDKPFADMAEFAKRGAIIPSEKKRPGPKPTRVDGRRLSRTSPERGGLPSVCPTCLHESPNRSALGQHTREHHKKGLKGYTEADFVNAVERRARTA